MTHPLLTPRYMVESPNKEKGELPYPNSPFRVGDILHEERNIFAFPVCVRNEDMPVDGIIDIFDIYSYLSKHKKYIPVGEIEDYPHIFRHMHWSEQRELGDMPRYLRRIKSGKEVVKAHKYRFIYGNWWVVPEWAKKVGYDSIVTDYLPATEAEYLEYLKSKEK